MCSNPLTGMGLNKERIDLQIGLQSSVRQSRNKFKQTEARLRLKRAREFSRVKMPTVRFRALGERL